MDMSVKGIGVKLLHPELIMFFTEC